MSRRALPVIATIAILAGTAGSVAARGPAVPRGEATARGAEAAVTAALPPDFTDSLVASVGSPTDIAFVPGTSSIYVTTQPGQVRLVPAGGGSVTTALDLSGKLCSNSERGLLGIELDPAFASNRRVYLYYTFRPGSTCPTNTTTNLPVNRVSRFTANADLTIPAASEVVLLDNIPSVAGNHNGGDLGLGADGLLYVSVGDGGCKIGDAGRCASQNDNARFLSTPLGKILRIGLDGAIPASNPWNAATGARRCGDPAGVPSGSGPCRETFAWGLRNPFRIAFQPGTNAFHINDVGQNTWEEIDLGQAGADYGWNVREGHCATGSTSNCGAPPAGMTNPIFDYGRGTGCGSITGGAFVPAGTWPASYAGSYLYADYVCGRIFQLAPNGSGGWTSSDFATGLGSSSAVAMAFGPSAAGQSLYYTTYAGGGSLRRVDWVPANQAPTAVLDASPLSGPAPLAVTFDASGSSDPDGDPLTYQFAFGDGATLQTSNPIVGHTYASAGTYAASVVVSDGRGGTSAPAGRTIQASGGNEAPVPVIGSPGAADTYAVGELVTLAGSATDAEDGALPASSLSWTVILHHNTHTHPFLGPSAGSPVTFNAPPPEDLAATTTSYLEIRLTATDSGGAQATVVRNFQPRTVPITFQTQPGSLSVVVNGTTVGHGTTLTSWQGYALNVDAPPQDQGRKTYVFQSWSDGGAQAHTIVTPASAETYKARFKAGASARSYSLDGPVAPTVVGGVMASAEGSRTLAVRRVV